MEGLSTTERTCVEQAMAADMLRQVEAWSAINSGSRNLNGLEAMIGELSGVFSDLPGELRFVDAAPVEAIDAAGKPYEVPHGRNLHLTVRPTAPVQLLFTGHMDTVFGTEHPFQSLTWLEPGKVLNGPGVADMKGGIACMVLAAEVLAGLGVGLRGDLLVATNTDEESSGAGGLALVLRGLRADAGIVTEPTGLDVWISCRGTSYATVTVRGRPGHAEVYSHLGIEGTAGTHDVITKIVCWLMPHKGPIVSHALPGTGHLLQEFVVVSTPGVSVPLRRLGLPPEAWVVAASRNGRALRVGQPAELTAEDRLVVALPPGQARQVWERLRTIEVDT